MIFLYRFDLKDNGIDFVLNEQIAADILVNVMDSHMSKTLKRTH
ncbi:hypothetical protein NPM06_09490 [Bacillus cereus]|nr:hypothetical protein [Bacillus cereus]